MCCSPVSLPAAVSGDRHEAQEEGTLEISVTKSEKALLIFLSGEITSRDEQLVMSETIAKYLAEGERMFLLDLSEVSYISSLGLAGLAAAYVRAHREGGEIRLINPSRRVANVLELTRVADIFKSYPTIEEALAAD